MSYILDALQRAEQERQRKSGTVPGLQTRAMPVPREARDEGLRLSSAWAIGGTLIVALTVAAAVMLWRTPPASTPPATQPPTTGATAPLATTAAIPLPPTPGTALAEPLSAATTLQPLAPTSKDPMPAKMSTSASAPAERSAIAPATAPTASAARTAKSGVAPSAAPAVVLPFLKDLPEDFRRQVPSLAISGVVYSENPDQRLLLVNGQVLSQGSRAAPELTLEVIHPNSSDFNFRGTRFRLSH